MAIEECQHIADIEHQLELEPDPAIDWDAAGLCFDLQSN
jgi:hypothetical protein